MDSCCDLGSLTAVAQGAAPVQASSGSSAEVTLRISRKAAAACVAEAGQQKRVMPIGLSDPHRTSIRSRL